MAAMAVTKDELVDQGRQLMAASSEVRGHDLEYKITKLNDKWQRLQDLAATR